MYTPPTTSEERLGQLFSYELSQSRCKILFKSFSGHTPHMLRAISRPVIATYTSMTPCGVTIPNLVFVMFTGFAL